MYRTFHGPAGTGGNRSTASEIAQLSGTATYVGTAVGQYSFYEPLGSNSEYGEFTARATLTANFTAVGDGDDETVTGTIDEFNGHPDWTVTLKQRNIDATSGVIPVATHRATPSTLFPGRLKMKRSPPRTPGHGRRHSIRTCLLTNGEVLVELTLKTPRQPESLAHSRPNTTTSEG